ncbi:MAG TPA: bifunctional adenosylcobinamide kinase/adenosylcobinamide-phosphate guanylyltransferase [Thiotrichales bacterium]|nr:bifunctional adenosylcobinamide kinase/adenosylcobinamide-phosphate guanylyltransferase [Thiotrichales bacterium]
MKTLILGGVRSGKSRLAERLATESGLQVVYLATATAGDAEMRSRIDAHRRHRPPHWSTVEEPLALASTLQALDRPDLCVVVDCLTLWLTNLLMEGESRLERETRALLEGLPGLEATLVLVGNETGMGVIPASALARLFCDAAGRLHQRLAERCDRVVLTVAGLPHLLKGDPL